MLHGMGGPGAPHHYELSRRETLGPQNDLAICWRSLAIALIESEGFLWFPLVSIAFRGMR